ncbi:KamA family radical SAM protein, partial [Simkania negevensis]|nr:KamA family radical SAM protein [Simkania negevensis]
MITRSPSLWRKIQRENITCWKTLADFLQLTEQQRDTILPTSHFPLNLPRRLADKIKKGSLNDPILLQFLPSQKETASAVGYTKDPVGDRLAQKTPRLIHKYQGRALLYTTSACAMHCRYCFRQHYSTENKTTTPYDFAEELQLIAQDPSLSEIILSGGDPLSLSDQRLAQLIAQLNHIPHIKRLRFHTRFPIGIPERIDEDFCNMLKTSRMQIWFLLHANHASELDDEVMHAMRKIQALTIPTLSQTVLLKGVNDDLTTLKTLCERLVNNAITPYYLHQLDRVQGAEHFEVADSQAVILIEQLRNTLSGYAIPTL